MKAPKPDRRHILWLAEADVSAARRILGLLAETDRSSFAGDRASPAGPAEALERARNLLLLRPRRIEIFGPDFSSEPPFAMLLALYSHEGRQPALTANQLSEFAWLAPSTNLRWLDLLVKGGWVERSTEATDRRRARIVLTDKARHAMQELFG